MAERILKLFVSSPGDVAAERQRIDFVVERLNGEFAGRVRIQSIRWETEYYSAHDTFQKQIPEAADCDVVVAIFRARLGTPLPDDFPRLPSGEPYPSGTAYEVLSAVGARKAGKDLPDKAYQADLAIADRLATSDPGNAGWQRDLSFSYGRLASAYRNTGQTDDARAALNSGRAIIVALVTQHPGWSQWEHDLQWFDAQIAALGK